MQDRATPRHCRAAEVSAERIARGRQSVGRAGGDTAFRCLDHETTGSPVKSITFNVKRQGVAANQALIRDRNGGFLLASAGPLQGQTAEAVAKLAPYAEAKENANRQAKEWIARGTPGLALAVATAGKIVNSEGSASRIIYPGTRVVVALVTNLTGADWKREEVEAVAEKFANVRK
jgi:hypothetical protein